ncbi:hypothetical protein PQR39_21105 [Paraburkholderia sediminicola]|uniref:hypothetical protein n=1 Tax=Paraburkholderia sediminicola TaxID=458836 RepID=UPI0038B70CB2
MKLMEAQANVAGMAPHPDPSISLICERFSAGFLWLRRVGASRKKGLPARTFVIPREQVVKFLQQIDEQRLRRAGNGKTSI